VPSYTRELLPCTHPDLLQNLNLDQFDKATTLTIVNVFKILCLFSLREKRYIVGWPMKKKMSCASTYYSVVGRDRYDSCAAARYVFCEEEYIGQDQCVLEQAEYPFWWREGNLLHAQGGFVFAYSGRTSASI
jgi:hypothetical protein